MADQMSVDPRLALYWADQWKRLKGASASIPATLAANLYSLGPSWKGDDEYGHRYDEAVEPGVKGGEIVCNAVGDCADGISTGVIQTVNEYTAADHRSADLIA